MRTFSINGIWKNIARFVRTLGLKLKLSCLDWLAKTQPKHRHQTGWDLGKKCVLQARVS